MKLASKVTLLIGFIAFFNLPTVIAGSAGILPIPISNNAVAAVNTKNGWQIFSFNGLLKERDWSAVSNIAMRFDVTTQRSQILDNVPYTEGRLASIAVSVADEIYLFGGYTVAANQEEKSIAAVHKFEPENSQFSLFSEMPIAVDDSVALVYQDRFIYLISGWHDSSNVTDVQILDTQTKQWHKGTPYPGEPVFGHSGGIVENKLIIVDGVKVTAIVEQKRQYGISAKSFSGIINPTDFTQIDWQPIPQHPGTAKYRMAASGIGKGNKVVFIGGSINPYNYNGVGYDGTPSEPDKQVFAWDFTLNQWEVLADSSIASMDHRGLIHIDDSLLVIGGMLAKQQVSSQIIEYKLAPQSPKN